MTSSDRGQIIWLMGLSGAGKSTICTALAMELEKAERRVQVLDADELRRTLCKDLGFEVKDRFENVRRIAHVANLLAQHGILVLVAAITPLNAMSEVVRSIIPDVAEIYINASLEKCEERDTKGLYNLVRLGKLKNMTGIDFPYQPPLNPCVTCYTELESITESSAKVLQYILHRARKY